jgi:hypothetical protein
MKIGVRASGHCGNGGGADSRRKGGGRGRPIDEKGADSGSFNGIHRQRRRSPQRLPSAHPFQRIKGATATTAGYSGGSGATYDFGRTLLGSTDHRQIGIVTQWPQFRLVGSVPLLTAIRLVGPITEAGSTDPVMSVLSQS